MTDCPLCAAGVPLSKLKPVYSPAAKFQMLSRAKRPRSKTNNFSHYHRARKYERRAVRAGTAGNHDEWARLIAKCRHYRKLAGATKFVIKLRGPARYFTVLDDVHFIPATHWQPIAELAARRRATNVTQP